MRKYLMWSEVTKNLMWSKVVTTVGKIKITTNCTVTQMQRAKNLQSLLDVKVTATI